MKSAEVSDADRSEAAEGEPEADEEEPHDADAIDHEVHGHRVEGVLGSGEARLHEGEARLHEHDQEAADQQPGEVDAKSVLIDHVGQFRREWLGFLGGRQVIRGDGAGGEPDQVLGAAAVQAGWIAVRRAVASGLRRAARDGEEHEDEETAEDEASERQGPFRFRSAG